MMDEPQSSKSKLGTISGDLKVRAKHIGYQNLVGHLHTTELAADCIKTRPINRELL